MRVLVVGGSYSVGVYLGGSLITVKPHVPEIIQHGMFLS